MPVSSLPETSKRHSWESSPRPAFKPWLVAAVVTAMAGVSLGLLVRRFDWTRSIFMENGPIEMLQPLVLAIVAAVFGLTFLKSSGARAAFCLVAAFATVFAVTREVPRCNSAYTDGSSVCLAGTWKVAIVMCALGISLAALFWRRRELSVGTLRLANLLWIWPCIAVILMLVGAEAAEHLDYVEIEESVELVAYLYLLAFSLQVLRYASEKFQDAINAGANLSTSRRVRS